MKFVNRRTALLGILVSASALGAGNAMAGTPSLASKQTLTRIAFGSCAMQWKPQRIWNTIAATKPDLFVFLGDAIYGDWDGKKVFVPTPETLRRDWGRLAAIPEFRSFREHVPILATWDNHDYGKYDGGAEFVLKEASKKVFLDFFREPGTSDRRKRPGIYDARIVGQTGKRVQLILLDTRTFKSPFLKDRRPKTQKKALNIRGQYLPNHDPAATLLGAAQWSWLEEQLRQSAELRIVASSTQVIADEKGMDEWGNFPLERQRLFRLISRTKTSGVLLLSGNVHFAEISANKNGPYPLYDFTSSGMTHNNPEYAKLSNNRRIAGPYADPNFGLVDIDWSGEQGPQIVMRALGLDGRTAFEKTILLRDIRP